MKLNKQLLDACKDGNFTLVTHIFTQNNFKINKINLKYAFTTVCEYGHLKIAKWFAQKNPLYKFFFQNNNAFKMACYNGHFKVAKWLLFENPSINISEDENWAFTQSCVRGHLKIAKWLYSINPNINISSSNEYVFRNSCYNGHIKVAKWLLKIKPNINIYAENGYAFRLPCEREYFYISTWIWSLCKTPKKDLLNYCNLCFIDACKHGKLNVLQWIVSLFDNNIILFNIENGFKQACAYNNINVATWLQRLKPFMYSFYIKNNIIINQQKNCILTETILFIIYGLKQKGYVNNITATLLTTICKTCLYKYNVNWFIKKKIFLQPNINVAVAVAVAI